MDEQEKNSLGYTPGEYAQFKKYAWRFLILFSLLYMTVYCCRLNLGNAAAVMMAEEGWTSADIGILTSILFRTYGIGQMVNGRLSDIFGFVAYVGAALQSIIYGFILDKAGWNTVFVSISVLCLISAFIAGRKEHGTAQ